MNYLPGTYPPIKDMTGLRFGRLVAKSYVDTVHSQARWLCVCDCGTEKTISGNALRMGNTQSCGCFHKEQMLAQPPRLRHGHAREGQSSTYKCWTNMRSRCTNPKVKQYKDWGGRGIKVCERWLVFDNFLADMGEKPKGMQIDRIDNDGDYKPSNCRWVTPKENSATRRRKSKWS
jgi:hypothetical protein